MTLESAVIDAERLKDEFLDLVCISSLSRREGAIARRLEVILKGMGATVEVDDAGERVGGETGNLLARFPGSAPGAPPFLLSCHMDTVGPAAADPSASSTATSSAPTGRASSAATTRRGSSRSSRRSGSCASGNPPRRHRGGADDLRGVRADGGQALRHRPVAPRRGSCWTSTACPSSSRAPRGQSARVHRPRARRPRGGLPRGGALRHPDGGGSDRGDAARPPRRGDHRESRGDPGRPRDQHRARPRRRPGRDAQPQPGEARGADGSHAPALPGRVARRSVRVGGREHSARAVEVEVHHQYERLDVPDDAGIVALVQGAAAGVGRACPTRVDRRWIRRQRIRGARDRGRESRVRHAGDPHGERVGRRPRPGADGGAGGGDGPRERGA